MSRVWLDTVRCRFFWGCKVKIAQWVWSLIIITTLSLPGFSISVVEEDGIQQLYITDVRAGGLAFAKGSLAVFSSLSFISLPHFPSLEMKQCGKRCDICAVLLLLCNTLSARRGFWTHFFSTLLNSKKWERNSELERWTFQNVLDLYVKHDLLKGTCHGKRISFGSFYKGSVVHTVFT